MWKCEACKKDFDDEITAIEVKFGKVDSKKALESGNRYKAFYTKCSWAPLCDDCSVAYIKGELG